MTVNSIEFKALKIYESRIYLDIWCYLSDSNVTLANIQASCIPLFSAMNGRIDVQNIASIKDTSFTKLQSKIITKMDANTLSPNLSTLSTLLRYC